jgi:hypothetical protein
MSALPAYCPKCHSIFPCHAIGIMEGVAVNLTSIGTNCPVCGFGGARVNDGVYRATKNAIEVLSGPDSTRIMMEALKALLERLAGAEITKDTALEEAAELSPKYAALLDAFYKLGFPPITLLIAIIAAYLQYEGNKSSSEDMKHILDAITEQTIVLKDVMHKPRIDGKRSGPSGKEAKGEASSDKNPSSRRTKVNQERRKRLKEHRCAFGQARHC